jgi:uncharacterized membrane protein
MRASRNLLFLSAVFVFAGTMHFVVPAAYASIIPDWVPFPVEMVYFTGVAEIAGGIGLLVERFRRTAALGLIALLIAVFPANVQMLQDAIAANASGLYRTLLFLRLPIQPLLIVWVYRVCFRRRYGTEAAGHLQRRLPGKPDYPDS